jgi:thioredoxin 1
MNKIISILVMVFGTLISFAQTELTDENAEAKLLVNNNRLIVLDFYATWCGPCKRMDPILKELENKYKSQVDFYKIDVDENIIDDKLEISAMPTYLFIKNSSSLEKIEGSMSKTSMEDLIIKHMNAVSESTASTSTSSENIDLDDFSQTNIDKLWDSSSALNSLAWNAYKTYNDVKILLKAIKIVERSIELEKNYDNVDTHAALLYKTGNYNQALKKAKEAIDIAKNDGFEYSTTTELIENIIEEM